MREKEVLANILYFVINIFMPALENVDSSKNNIKELKVNKHSDFYKSYISNVKRKK